MKGGFQKKSNKMQTINLVISSLYHPTDKILQKDYNNYLSSIIAPSFLSLR